MKLNGCVNDCADNVQLCVNKLGVPSDQIMVLADGPVQGVKGYSAPTKQNILSSIKRLVNGAQAGDVLYFSYSGHGTQVPDASGTEADGMDEAIVPSDYESTKKLITDDELSAYLVDPLPEGVVLTAIFDCCHSATILDLDNIADGSSGGGKNKAGKKKYKKSKTKEMSEDMGVGVARAIPAVLDYVSDPIARDMECRARGFGGPSVFCYSGCRDDQTSLDMTIGGKSCGALTSCYMKTMNAGGANSDYDTVFRTTCKEMDGMRRNMPALVQAPQLTYCDNASPSDASFHQGAPSGGHAPDYPNPHHGQPPRKSGKDKKDKKEKPGKADKKEKKEKPAKAPKAAKEKKDKGKKGKSRDLNDSDSDSESDSETEMERKADAGRHLLAAAFGRH